MTLIELATAVAFGTFVGVTAAFMATAEIKTLLSTWRCNRFARKWAA